MMLTNITDLIADANAYCVDEAHHCPIMNSLLAIKKSLQTEVKNLGENDRDQRP